MQNNKTIWTFWEPKENLPAYLKLCMKTWQKFLPEYQVIVLDYSNLDNYLGKDFFDPILYQKFSLPKQADAIRCAVLRKYGGIWMDCDTIITSDKIRDILSIKSSFVLIGTHVAFIKADKNSPILKQWLKNIQKNIARYKLFLSKYNFWAFILNPKYRKRYKRVYKKFKRWDYLGNMLLDRILKHYDSNLTYFQSVDKTKMLPELCLTGISSKQNYQKFYFESNDISKALNGNGGLILLHNSWTPDKYLKMNETTFYKQNNTLASVLKTILKI